MGTNGEQGRPTDTQRRLAEDHREPPVPLRRSERRKATARAAVGPRVVHEAIRQEGEEEIHRPGAALFWSGVAAGLSMGFSLIAEGVLRAALPDAPWRTLVVKLGYSFGFVFVVLGRQQLFTENTLTVMLPLLSRPSLVGLGRVARVWGIVLAANVLGAIAFAYALHYGHAFDDRQLEAFGHVARDAFEPSFGTHLVRGIYGGWLIALMVWLLPAARSARFFVIVTVTWLVAAGRFTHVIAGSVEVLYLVAGGEVSFPQYLGRFLLPALLGNSIGGVSLVAALNHAQAMAGAEPADAGA